MKQPKINGRQARWLVYLTPYDFIIKHRPGILNPADGPSRRPDYKAQGEPSLVQKDLLASKLVESDPDLSETARLDFGLCNTVKCQLCEVVGPESCMTNRPELENRLYRTARPELELSVARPEPIISLPEAELCDTARVTWKVNARSPLVDSKGQWALSTDKEAVGSCSRTPIATVQGRCAMPRAEDSEAGHLLELVRVQAVTRREAKEATREENPLVDETAEGLLDLILKSQGMDPLCTRLKKELDTDLGRKGYSIGQRGLLYYKGRIVVPLQKSLIQELLYLYHDDQFSGHWGIEKTKELLERKFYWPKLAVDVREYVLTCHICQNISIPRHKPYGKLEPLPVPEGPWKEVSLDFITQLPSSYIGTKEYDAILVVVDHYTKMAKFIPAMTNISAPEFTALFHEKIELQYGSPRGIVSDRDTQITSKFWAEVCTYSLIKRRMSTAFHPQTDGQTEILNRILENYLRAYTSLEQMNWAKLLRSAEYTYNNSRNSSTKITPFKALYGYDPELQFDVKDATTQGEAPAAHDRILQLQELRDRLKEELIQSQEQQAKYYNQRHQPKLFKCGNLIKLSTRNLRLKYKKIKPRWIGLCRDLQGIGPKGYRHA